VLKGGGAQEFAKKYGTHYVMGYIAYETYEGFMSLRVTDMTAKTSLTVELKETAEAVIGSESSREKFPLVP
jgi:hypothetical protein